MNLETAAALRTLDEANGTCQRCNAHRPSSLTAEQSSEQPGRFVACCTDHVSCRRRVRAAQRASTEVAS